MTTATDLFSWVEVVCIYTSRGTLVSALNDYNSDILGAYLSYVNKVLSTIIKQKE